MTKGELILALKACRAPDDADIYIVCPDEDEMKQRTCLDVEEIGAETAHDEEETPICRIYLFDPCMSE